VRSCKNLRQKVDAFHNRTVSDPHHRYRSWEYCYTYFRHRGRARILRDKNVAALHLGFYLASWGMYRGSTFLLWRTYTVHEPVIERLASTEFRELWVTEVGSRGSDTRFVELILAAVHAVKDAYAPFGEATDTLASKVLLVTLACLPACDRFMIDGWKASGRQYSRLNRRFVERVLEFCRACSSDLQAVQTTLRSKRGVNYPIMKLVDMYFWQMGYEAALRAGANETVLRD
jgi:hypothetical protein